MTTQSQFNPKLDFAIERFIDAPPRLVWAALTLPEHLKEWYMPRAWGRVARAELDLRPGGIVRIEAAPHQSGWAAGGRQAHHASHTLPHHHKR